MCISGNVVWTNKQQPIEALISLSCPIRPSKRVKNNTKQKNKKSVKTKEVSTKFVI